MARIEFKQKEYQGLIIDYIENTDRGAIWAGMGMGKGLAVEEPVLTPAGWKPIGTLVVGDKVIGKNGRPTNVTGVFPQGVKERYRVTFSDGSSVVTDESHLWAVSTPKKREHYVVKSTGQLLAEGLYDSVGNRKFSIPLVEPVIFRKKKLPIEPYLLGVLLGDGCFSENSCLTVTTDESLIQGHDVRVTDIGSGCVKSIAFRGIVLKNKLKELNLWGKRSWEKDIPTIYLLGSTKQRLAILQGLLDTDGYAVSTGGAEFTSTSEDLTDNVVELAQSLGGVARKSEGRFTRHQGGVGRKSWRVNVKLPSGFEPFRLKRKLDSWVPPVKYKALRALSSIEKIHDGETVCIAVDAEDQLYVTKDYIVTHNTSSTLTALDRRFLQGYDRPVLVLAPKMVAETTWPEEARKWKHLRHTRVVPIIGDEAARRRALRVDASIYTTNYEQVPWLVEHFGERWPFQHIIADESTRLKNFRLRQGGVRAKALGSIAHSKVKQFHELTGTPAPNGLLDLWGQIWMLDAGMRLGRTYTAFRDRWFAFRDRWFGSGYDGSWKPFEHSEAQIHEAIKDLCLTINPADYFDLEEPIVVNKYIDLPPRARALYDEMEKKFFIEIEGHEVEAFHSAARSQKLLQLANGAIYVDPLVETDEDPRSLEFKGVHDAKIEALESIVNEANGMPVLVAFNFRSDLTRLKKAFPKGVHLKSKGNTAVQRDWNEGKIPVMFAHPQCLHPSTEVLTEYRGWVKLVEVQLTERVFDGVEFVNHSGCQYSGYREVIDCFGVKMTRGHRLLIKDKWERAEDVRDSNCLKREALYRYKGVDKGLSKMFALQSDVRDIGTERKETQQEGVHPLPEMLTREIPQPDRYTDMEFVERPSQPSERYFGQGLRRSWNNCLRGVARLQEVLRGYVSNVSARLDDRTVRREQGILERKLYLGDDVRAARKQTQNTAASISREEHALGRVVQSNRSEPLHCNNTVESRYERRPGGRSCDEIFVQEEPEKTHVYDLVDCGPRSRFLIRNAEGEVFVSHNSAGHGLNLQDGGNILVFFGHNWNLEHSLQILERIGPMRQLQAGNNRPVFIYNIIARDTIDELVMARVETKKSVQDILLEAMSSRKRK